MAISTPFQWATTTHYCTVESGAGTANCVGAWQVNRNVIELNGSRQVYFGSVPPPFLTTAGVTFGAVVVPAQDLTGTATLTPGATLTITGPDKQPVTITDGRFSVPVTFGAGLLQRVQDAAPAGVDAALDLIGTDEAMDVSLALVADRDRIAPEEARRAWMGANGGAGSTLFVDGLLAGIWRVEDGRVVVEPLRRLTRSERQGLEAEVTRVEDLLATPA